MTSDTEKGEVRAGLEGWRLRAKKGRMNEGDVWMNAHAHAGHLLVALVSSAHIVS